MCKGRGERLHQAWKDGIHYHVFLSAIIASAMDGISARRLLSGIPQLFVKNRNYKDLYTIIRIFSACAKRLHTPNSIVIFAHLPKNDHLESLLVTINP